MYRYLVATARDRLVWGDNHRLPPAGDGAMQGGDPRRRGAIIIGEQKLHFGSMPVLAPAA
jgi:hypothetical protein